MFMLSESGTRQVSTVGIMDCDVFLTTVNQKLSIGSGELALL